MSQGKGAESQPGPIPGAVHQDARHRGSLSRAPVEGAASEAAGLRLFHGLRGAMDMLRLRWSNGHGSLTIHCICSAPPPAGHGHGLYRPPVHLWGWVGVIDG